MVKTFDMAARYVWCRTRARRRVSGELVNAREGRQPRKAASPLLNSAPWLYGLPCLPVATRHAEHAEQPRGQQRQARRLWGDGCHAITREDVHVVVAGRPITLRIAVGSATVGRARYDVLRSDVGDAAPRFALRQVEHPVDQRVVAI